MALKIAEECHLYSVFFEELPKDYLILLKEQQEEVMESDIELYENIQVLADLTAQEIISQVPFEKKELKSILLVGEKESEKRNKEDVQEGDIVLVSDVKEKEKDLIISLKLCKKSSYVNSKNGGARSFIEKYFSSFGEKSTKFQTQFNKSLDSEFYFFLNSLLSEKGVEDESENISHLLKKFNEYYSSRPGELPENVRIYLKHYYHQLAKKLFSLLEDLYIDNSRLFFLSIASLLGLSNEKIWQFTCFYENNKTQRYQEDEIFFFSTSFIAEGKVVLVPPKENISSFNILIESEKMEIDLQVRIKPMQSITVPSPKINCSIKSKKKS